MWPTRRLKSGATPKSGPLLGAPMVANLCAHSRVVVSSYLLAPGYFLDLAAVSGAAVTSAPLLRPDAPPPAPLVELVLDRYSSAVLSRAA